MALNAKDELKTVVTTKLGRPVTWIHADLFRSNFLVDQLEGNSSWPVFIYLTPVEKRGQLEDNTQSIKGTISVSGYFLDRPNFETQDYTSEQVEPIIDDMESLASKLVYNLNKQSVTAVTDMQRGGIVDWKTVGVYSKFDANVFGVLLTMDWPVDERKTGC